MSRMNKTRQQLADFFIASLKEDKLPWRAVWQAAMPVNAVTGARYRGVNNLLLSWVAEKNGLTDPRWCTFTQAKRQGWLIKKGAKGYPVEYWAFIDPAIQKMLTWDEVHRIQRNDPDRAKTLQLRYRISHVFHASDVVGIPKAKRQKPLLQTGAITAKRDLILKNMDLAYREQGSRAYYAPAQDQVTLPPMQSFESEYGFFCTFLHECGHATAHPSRLNRELNAGDGGDYAREELRAEIASAFVSQELGLRMDPNEINENLDLHKAYIQSWISMLQEKPDELFAAIKDSNLISDYLVNAGEFQRTQAAYLQEAVTVDVGDINATVKNSEQYGGYSLTLRGEGRISKSTLRNVLKAYWPHISELRVREGITEIGKQALWKMPKLQMAELPHSLQRIGPWALDCCPKLKTVKFSGSISEWDAIQKGEAFLPEQFEHELRRAQEQGPFATRPIPAAETVSENECGYIIRADETLMTELVLDEEYELEL